MKTVPVSSATSGLGEFSVLPMLRHTAAAASRLVAAGRVPISTFLMQRRYPSSEVSLRENSLIRSSDRALSDRVAALLVAIAAAAVLCACSGGSKAGFDPFGTEAVRSFGLDDAVPWRDPGYFPHQFPTPIGEIEPLPAQF